MSALSYVDRVEIKTVGDAGSGSFEAVLSNGQVDRDGEYFAPGALNPLPRRIPIEVDHELSVRATVGSGIPYYDGDNLKVYGTFASTPLAQEVRTLVKEGHINSLSIAFRKAQREKDAKGVRITRAELVNASYVSFPANAGALVTSAKSARGRGPTAAELDRYRVLAEANASAVKILRERDRLDLNRDLPLWRAKATAARAWAMLLAEKRS